jgi:hypothetical protein
MSKTSLPHELEHQIRLRTGRRVRHLAVKLHADRVIIQGAASSYYIKQLAQEALLDLALSAKIENAIAVEETA